MKVLTSSKWKFEGLREGMISFIEKDYPDQGFYLCREAKFVDKAKNIVYYLKLNKDGELTETISNQTRVKSPSALTH